MLTYGIEQAADIRAENITMSPTGTSFTIVTPWGEERLLFQWQVSSVL
ncbi:hypothetical protein [Sinobaca sp. H24]|nr:hypothetical protein [Sinobaca sp. H24]